MYEWKEKYILNKMQIKNKNWIIEKKYSPNIIDQLLTVRNIDKVMWSKFLKPSFENDLHDPFLLSDMEIAVARIKKAIDRKETIGIFGDYDADGIPATALLSEVLEKYYNLKTAIYIPTRQEGYGLNKNGIDYFRKSGVTLMLTIDLGIREIDNVKYANNYNINTIIIDHHEPGDKLPDAFAIINPKRKDSKYPFRELSAGGVTFKLIQALGKKLGKITSNDQKWMLDLVGITTICDMVPLIDENRIFAKYGLIVLQKTKRLGLRKIYEVSNINPVNINVYTIGFQIGPRLNAPGRLDHANESYYILREEDEKKALALAGNLNKINIKRQDEMERILNEGREKIRKDKLDTKKIIFISDKNWSSGLIGLVAGRITEEYARPCFIFQRNELNSKGSARSIDGFDLVEVLEQSKDLLENFGGHTKAAGMTVRNVNLEKLYKKLLVISQKKLNDEDLIPKIKIDAVLTKDQISISLLDKIKRLEPFGMGNPRPVFAVENVKAENVKKIGKDSKHLRFDIYGLKTIAFNWGDIHDDILDKHIDIAFTLDEDTWTGKNILQLKVVDIRFK